LPDRSRRLLTRTGFFRPSLEGGLPLLPLFRPTAFQFGDPLLQLRDQGLLRGVLFPQCRNDGL
jgi:hypothetical protein